MADQRTDAFTEDTAPALDDVIYVEHDPGGTPANRKLRVRNLSIPRMTAAELPAAPPSGFAAYVTDNTRPTGSVIPDATVPPGPGLWVFDGGRWDPPWNLPWGCMGVDSLQSDFGFTAEAAITGLTLGAITFRAGRRIKLELSWSAVRFDAADNEYGIYITESTTHLAEHLDFCYGTGTNTSGGSLFAIVEPTAAVHTYNARIARVFGAGNGTLEASATAPVWLLATDIGPAVAAPS